MNVRNNIYLIGFMGVGKTTIGRALEQKMRRKFVDLDDAIVKEKGMEITKIFQDYGEETFRLWEKESLLQYEGKGVILATGGGVVEREENLPYMLSSGTVVYLQAPFHILFSRIASDTDRPLTKEGEEGLKKRFKRRQVLYQQAKLTIHTENKTPEQIASEIYDVMKV